MNTLPRTKSNRAILFCMILCMLFCVACSSPEETKANISVSGIYFDTFVSITAYDDTSKEVLDDALQLCADYEKVFSRTMEGSELRLYNESIQKEEGIRLSKDMTYVVDAGIKYGDLSEGRFDIALGNVTQLWDFHSQTPTVPDKALVKEAVAHSGSNHLKLTEDVLKSDDSLVNLDLGGIAKGYIANRVRDYLVGQGCKEAVIALGGNIVCIGDKGGRGYTVGITKPFETANTSTEINVADTSVVTSGVYERCFEDNGVLYHHIIDSDTGYPAETDLLSVTIVCGDSMKADAFSTTVLMMGEEEGEEFLAEQIFEESTEYPITKAILINDRQQITVIE